MQNRLRAWPTARQCKRCGPWAPCQFGAILVSPSPAFTTARARPKSSRFCTSAHCLLGGSLTAIPRFGRICASRRRLSPCSLSSDSERQRATGHWHPKSAAAENFDGQSWLTRGFASRLHAPLLSWIDRIILARALNSASPDFASQCFVARFRSTRTQQACGQASRQNQTCCTQSEQSRQCGDSPRPLLGLYSRPRPTGARRPTP